MKIVYLTAGTGQFYCGSCMRDHAVAMAMRRAGHEVTIMPLYLPLLVDIDQPKPERIYMGGINTYLQHRFALFRKTPAWLDRIWDARPLLGFAARFAGMTKPRELGEITLSTLHGRDGKQKKEFDKILDHLAADEPADIICLSNALLSGFAEPIARRLGIPVVCSLQGEDTFVDGLPEPFRSQTWAALSSKVPFIARYVAVSAYHGSLMAQRMNIPEDQLAIVHNGIPLDGYRELATERTEPVIGFLAALIYNKGLHTLVEAFIEIKRRGRIPGAKLSIAGSLVPAGKAYVDEQMAAIAAAGYAQDVQLQTDISREEKLAFLSGLQAFSVPAAYGESFGLYVLEALAAGVPVVQPNHAGFPEVLKATGGGVLTPVGDSHALADALESLLLDRERRQRLGAEGQANVFEQFGSEHMAGRFLDVLTSVVSGQSSSSKSASKVVSA